MKVLYVFSILILFIFINQGNCQYTHTFTEVTRIFNGGSFNNATFGFDGNIFVARGTGGLNTYQYKDSTFFHKSSIADAYSNAKDVKFRSDGIIFLANYYYGLYAYKYENDGFEFLSSIDERTENIALGPDGTVFTVCEDTDYLRAYEFINSTFYKKSEYKVNSLANVTVDEHGTIYIASGFNEGVKAFDYDGAKFIQKAEISNTEGYGKSVDARNDSILFLANSGDGIYAYRYRGSSFQQLDFIATPANDIAVFDTLVYVTSSSELYAFTFNNSTFKQVGFTNLEYTPYGIALTVNPNGDILISNGDRGMKLYKFNKLKFELIAEINDSGEPQNVAFDNKNKIYLASGYGGLQVYNFDNNILNYEAAINNRGFANDVIVGPEGVIFLACRDSGLYAYELNNNQLDETAHVNDGDLAWNVDRDSYGNIFLANGQDGVRAYQYNGSSFVSIGHINDGIGAYAAAVSIFIDNSDNIYVAYGDDGVKMYNFENGEFSLLAKRLLEDWFYSGDVAVNENGTIFSSGGMAALLAYAIQDTNLIRKATLPNNDADAYEVGVDIGPDGTIYRAANNFNRRSTHKIFALDFKDSSFKIKAYLNVSKLYNINVREDGLIFVSSERGLIVYKLDENSTSINSCLISPKEFVCTQNYPNPFNPETTIKYNLPANQSVYPVKIKIYDALGRLITTLKNEPQNPGIHSVKWNGKNTAGQSMPSGIYFCVVEAGQFKATQKILLVR